MALRGSRSAMRLSPPMPIIAEDDIDPPAVLENSVSASRNLVAYRSFASLSSPAESTTGLASKPKFETERRTREEEDRNEVTRRGRWYRLGLFVVVSVALGVGLGVGLTVRLRDHYQSNPTNPLPSAIFPAGSYSLTTALINVSTACTSDPSTWSCFPFTTYNASAPASSSSSTVTFDWIITPVSPYDYVISSSAASGNSTLVTAAFANISLALFDANTDMERFFFSVTATKSVTLAVPQQVTERNISTPAASSISNSSSNSDDGSTICRFNDTVLTATLWTRARASFPPGVAALPAPANASSDFVPWPYQLDVQQVQAAGAGVPGCWNADGQPVMVDNDLAVLVQEQCSCRYANYGLPSSASPFPSSAGNGTMR